MAKKQSFAHKSSKVKLVKICPVCNEIITPTLLVRPKKSSNGADVYKKRHIGICKCNQKELLG